MKNTLILFLISIMAASCSGQSYNDEIEAHREKYKQDFLEDDHSPLKKSDLAYLRFFDADETYRISASFAPAVNAAPFDMATMNGSTKKYIEYGTVTFKLHDKTCSLHLYQSLSLMSSDEYKDYLFVPFTDKTNGKTTYGGGRYLDFSISDIKHNEMAIDFNKAYNPYCAYSSGYSCPKPPADNALSIEINAGEQEFGKAH